MPDPEIPVQRALYRGSLTDNSCKARYGVTYLRSICNQAGMPLSEISPDEDAQAIDCMIILRSGAVMVQVKCTSQFSLKGRSASWPMELHWQQSWEEMQIPVYFVIVILENGDPDKWLRHVDDGTFHHAAAYWKRVDIDNRVDRIHIDKNQRLTTETFHHWMLDHQACFTPPAVKNAG